MLRRSAVLLLALALVGGSATNSFAGPKKAGWERAWEHELKKLDKDGDGQISKAEIEAAIAAEKAKHEEKKAEKGEKPAAPVGNGGKGGKGVRHPHVHLHKDFDKIDTDHDGKISRDEFKAAWVAAEEAAKSEQPKKTEPAPTPVPAPTPAK